MNRVATRCIPLASTPRVLAATRNASSISMIGGNNLTPTSKGPGTSDEIAQDPAGFSADPNAASQEVLVGRSVLSPPPTTATTTTTSATSSATASAAAAVSTNDWSEIGGMVVMGGFWF